MLKPTFLVAVLALVLAGPAAAHVPKPISASMPLEVQERRLVVNLAHSRGAVAWLERRKASRGAGVLRRELRFHRAAARWQASRLEHVRALRAVGLALRDYASAVRYVERWFGPQPFLWSCPRSEGGFGGFVMNRQGSDAGGWLQFMPGTFWSVIGDAVARARARGMLVPAAAVSWTSPLGQALAGVEMLRDGRRGEWVGSTC